MSGNVLLTNCGVSTSDRIYPVKPEPHQKPDAQAMNPCLRHGFTACRGLRPLDPLCRPCWASKLKVNLYIGLSIHTNPVHIYAIQTYPIPPCSILCTYILSPHIPCPHIMY